MTERIWRGGVIGAGVWSDNQLTAWANVPGARIVALCDRLSDRLEASARKHGIEHVFTDAATMLQQMQLDFVDICTRPEGHAPLIRLAVEHNLPVLCQKPFCNTLEEAQEVVKLCQQRGIPLMVNENFRWQGWYRQVKMLLDEGAIGSPFTACIHWRLRATMPVFCHPQTYFQHMPRLAVYELGVHYLDVFRYLFGEPHRVFARLQRVSSEIAGEDVQHIVLMYDQPDLVCQINQSWASVAVPEVDSYADDDRLEIAHPLEIDGTHGTMVLRPDRTLWLHRDGGESVSWTFPKDTRARSLHMTLAHFVQCLEAGAPFETSGASYLDTMRLVYASYSSHETGLPVTL